MFAFSLKGYLLMTDWLLVVDAVSNLEFLLECFSLSIYDYYEHYNYDVSDLNMYIVCSRE